MKKNIMYNGDDVFNIKDISVELDETNGVLQVRDLKHLPNVPDDALDVRSAITYSMINLAEELSGKKVINPNEVILDFKFDPSERTQIYIQLSNIKLEVC